MLKKRLPRPVVLKHGFPGGTVIKKLLSAMQEAEETRAGSLGREDHLE